MPRNAQTVYQFVRDRYELERLNVGDEYLANLASTIQQFELFYYDWRGHRPALAELDEQAVTAWMRSMQSRQLSPVTINKKRNMLLAVWRLAHDVGEVKRRPRRIQSVRVPRRIPEAWSLEEIRRMLAAAEQAPAERGWSGTEWQALILFVYYTGERIGAVMQLERRHYDGTSGTIRIPAELRKDHEELVKHLPPNLCAMLDRLIGRWPRARFLFPWPYSHDELQRKFRVAVIKPAGLVVGRKKLFQGLRRSSFTLVAERLGLDAARWHAGHSQDLSQHYMDLHAIQRSRVIEALPDPLADSA